MARVHATSSDADNSLDDLLSSLGQDSASVPSGREMAIEMRKGMAALAAECKRLAERNKQLEERVSVLGQQCRSSSPPAAAEVVPASQKRPGADFGDVHPAAAVDKDDGEVDVENAYTLNPSVWDATLIMGTTPVGRAGSVFVLIMLLINLVVQSVFVILVSETLMEPAFDESTVQALREWRRNIAHSPRFADVANSRSLASRVCAEDAGLEVAGAQKGAISQIKKFIGTGKGNYRPGILMCCMCLLMWTLTVLREINDILQFSRAVIAIPRGHTQLILSDDTAHFASISLRRCFFVVIIQILRLVLALLLLTCGAFWLAYETDIPNLLLNAVALEFVFNVDELIFESLAPLQFRHVFNRCCETALTVAPAARRSGLDVRPVVTALLAFGFLASMAFGVMIPYDRTLFRARDAICGGEINFLYATGEVTFRV
jgi:hypothetical protein